MPATTTNAIDFSARVREAKSVLAYFSRFDDRGADAQTEQTALLFNALDRYEQAWEWALQQAVQALATLVENTTWTDPIAGASTEYQISLLVDRYI